MNGAALASTLALRNLGMVIVHEMQRVCNVRVVRAVCVQRACRLY